MLYKILKIYARFMMRLFCHSIYINKPELLRTNGPLLIASNHPNSFLDAIFYDILFDVPIWSLARGDVFNYKWAVPLLKSVKIFPVYRTREGVENLQDNYKTFEACMEVFKQNEAVTIFSEALCVNEWHLRPLRKGTARLAFMAWENNIDLKVLPIGINYSSFRRYGKQVDILPGEIITAGDFNLNNTDGNKYLAFNKKLESQLQTSVYEIRPGDNRSFDNKFRIKENPLRKALLWLPSLLAVVLHFPLYLSARVITKRLVNNNDHFDSLIFALLIILYPFYIASTTVLTWLFTYSAWSLLLIFLLPITVLSYVKRMVRKDKSFSRN